MYSKRKLYLYINGKPVLSIIIEANNKYNESKTKQKLLSPETELPEAISPRPALSVFTGLHLFLQIHYPPFSLLPAPGG